MGLIEPPAHALVHKIASEPPAPTYLLAAGANGRPCRVPPVLHPQTSLRGFEARGARRSPRPRSRTSARAVARHRLGVELVAFEAQRRDGNRVQRADGARLQNERAGRGAADAAVRSDVRDAVMSSSSRSSGNSPASSRILSAAAANVAHLPGRRREGDRIALEREEARLRAPARWQEPHQLERMPAEHRSEPLLVEFADRRASEPHQLGAGARAPRTARRIAWAPTSSAARLS